MKRHQIPDLSSFASSKFEEERAKIPKMLFLLVFAARNTLLLYLLLNPNIFCSKLQISGGFKFYHLKQASLFGSEKLIAAANTSLFKVFAQIISSAKMGNALSQKVKMGQSYLSNEKVLS